MTPSGQALFAYPKCFSICATMSSGVTSPDGRSNSERISAPAAPIASSAITTSLDSSFDVAPSAPSPPQRSAPETAAASDVQSSPIGTIRPACRLRERDRQSDRQLDVTRLPPEAEYGDERRMFPRVHVRIERDDIAGAIRARRRAEERERHGTIRHDGEQMIEGPFRPSSVPRASTQTAAVNPAPRGRRAM